MLNSSYHSSLLPILFLIFVPSTLLLQMDKSPPSFINWRYKISPHTLHSSLSTDQLCVFLFSYEHSFIHFSHNFQRSFQSSKSRKQRQKIQIIVLTQAASNVLQYGPLFTACIFHSGLCRTCASFPRRTWCEKTSSAQCHNEFRLFGSSTAL